MVCILPCRLLEHSDYALIWSFSNQTLTNTGASQSKSTVFLNALPSTSNPYRWMKPFSLSVTASNCKTVPLRSLKHCVNQYTRRWVLPSLLEWHRISFSPKSPRSEEHTSEL